MTAFDRFEPRLPELMDELARAAHARLLRRPAPADGPHASAARLELPRNVAPHGRDRPGDTLGQVPWRPIAIAAMLIAAAATTLVLIAGSQRRLPPAPFGPTSRIQVGDPIETRWFAADDTSLWVHQLTSMVRVDLATGAVTGTVPLSWMDYGYNATGAGSVWQTDYETGFLVRIDPTTNTASSGIAGRIGTRRRRGDRRLGVGRRGARRSGHARRSATNHVIAQIPVGPTGSAGPQIMTAGPHGVWVDIQNIQSVVRVDAATTGRAGVPLEGWVASDGTEVWIGLRWRPEWALSPKVVRIDPVSGKVITTVHLGTSDGIGGLAVGLGSVWVSSGGVIRIDSETGRILGHLDTGGDGGNVVVADGSVLGRDATTSHTSRGTRRP